MSIEKKKERQWEVYYCFDENEKKEKKYKYEHRPQFNGIETSLSECE